jgi:hypothetical protein
VVVATAHQHQQGDLEALAMGSGLILIASFARAAEVEMPWFEGG